MLFCESYLMSKEPDSLLNGKFTDFSFYLAWDSEHFSQTMPESRPPPPAAPSCTCIINRSPVATMPSTQELKIEKLERKRARINYRERRRHCSPKYVQGVLSRGREMCVCHLGWLKGTCHHHNFTWSEMVWCPKCSVRVDGKDRSQLSSGLVSKALLKWLKIERLRSWVCALHKGHMA